ncbi:MAG: ATP-binding protein [Nannocystaceae bacterium]
MVAPPGYTIGETLHQGSRSTVHRATRHRDGHAVILKIARESPPSPATLADFRRERRLSAGLEGEHLTRAHTILESEALVALVFDDCGGGPLSALELPLALPRFFEVALCLTAAVAELHSQQVIHCDIKPANAILAPAQRVRLTDFSLAMTFEEAALRPPSLAGTLAYMAPEQTGRIARGVDHRSDLYALGVTFYELLSARRPFADSDPAELIHAHLAQRPASLVAFGIPAPLAAIVDKLLAKDPDDRYQSAFSLRRDLELARGDAAQPATVGAGDRPARIDLRPRLYGRDAALDELVAAVTPAPARAQLRLVRGRQGLGRTSVLDAFAARVDGAAIVVRVDFDPFRRDVPFAALLRALDGLCDHLDALDPGRRRGQIARLRQHLGASLPAALDVLPRLRASLPVAAEVVSETAVAAQNRLQIALERLLQAFASDDAPLVILVDDLHAADLATRQLLQSILSDPDSEHILVVASAHERGEAGAEKIDALVASLRAAQAEVATVRLDPLDVRSVAALLRDALATPVGALTELAELLTQETGGAPLHVHHLLRHLDRVGALRFDHLEGRWRWSLAAIRGAMASLGPGELTAEAIAAMPAALVERLQIAACIGASFEVAALAAIQGEEIDETTRVLLPALRGGLLGEHGGQLRFTHERLRKAIYTAIPEDAVGELRLRVGRYLLGSAASTGTADAILLAAVEHIDAGRASLSSRDERDELAHLNLKAGRRAKLAGAYQTAIGYLRTGAELLGDDRWERAPELTFDLLLELAESEHLDGRRAESDATFAQLSERAVDPLALARVTNAQVSLLVAAADNNAAIAVGFATLRAVARALAGRDAPPDGDLLDLLPTIPDEDGRLTDALGPLVGSLLVATGMSHPALFERLSGVLLPSGNRVVTVDSITACFIVAFQRSVEPTAGEALQRWRERGEALLAASDGEPDSHLLFSRAALAHQCGPLRDALPLLEAAYQRGLVDGMFIFTSFACSHLLVDKIILGRPLDALAAEADRYLALMQITRVASATATQRVSRQLIAALRGETRDATSLSDADFDEDRFVRATLGDELPFASGWYLTGKLLLALLHRREEGLRELIDAARVHPIRTSGFIVGDLVVFYAALALARLPERGATEISDPLFAEARARLRARARTSPKTYAHMEALLDAERRRLRDDPLGAIDAFDRAIAGAEEHDFLVHAALAHELAGRFHAVGGRSSLSRLHLHSAGAAYRRWGAHAKADALGRLLGGRPDARESSSRPRRPRSSSGARASDRVDLASVLKASQAFSSLVDLDALIARILVIVVENAGAERGVLLLEENDGIRVMADFAPDGRPPLAAAGAQLHDARGVPAALLREVIVTGEAQVFENAFADPEARRDPYVREDRPRSLICLPITHQAVTLGALYLENNLVTGAFTRPRLEVLRILVTEIAIALENARHYAQVRRAQAAAEAANKAKSTFLANMSHELRTPLNAIIGYSELLHEESVDREEPALASDLLKIQRSAKHLLHIISDILDISKIEAGRLELARQEVVIADLIDELAAIITPQLRERGNRLLLRRDDGLRTIRSDPTKLRQILLNILGNAAKFTDDGEIHVALRRHPEHTLEVTIRDTGEGIAANHLERIFAPFQQVDDSPTRRHGGTGLGLAISRRLARLLGGDITVTSELGVGSTFVITTPIV